ncbi:MAG: nucleotide sugar dehydrogenase [Chloroflexi bacterium]|nr:nucleotide sugar dehydrogenase [Chloroflexota bacterium]
MPNAIKIPSSVVVVGLGYVGLPLALAFSKKLSTIGFDVDVARIDELLAGFDRNREASVAEIASTALKMTTDASCIADADFIIITVPTPVTADNKPDLSLLESACTVIGSQLRNRSGDASAPIIVFESTTYPGCTEDYCGPIIERESGRKAGEEFFLGYSPERTNFGDAEHTLETVIKVVSGQTADVGKVVGDTYHLIAKAGVYLAPDIKTAEASKVIENVQRDLNIALFNELAIIFDRMDIRSSEVFEAASTKWNFHRYRPGLVGGHCIPVDPYYLTHAAAEVGYDAEVVLAGRAVNEKMPAFIVEKIGFLIASAGQDPAEVTVLVLGQTFKQDVTDSRNSKAVVLARLMNATFGLVDIYDPFIPELSTSPTLFENVKQYDVVVLAVPHTEFSNNPEWIVELCQENGLIFDIGGAIDPDLVKRHHRRYWTL